MTPAEEIQARETRERSSWYALQHALIERGILNGVTDEILRWGNDLVDLRVAQLTAGLKDCAKELVRASAPAAPTVEEQAREDSAAKHGAALAEHAEQRAEFAGSQGVTL